MRLSKGYYEIACNDLQYLFGSLESGFYNQMVAMMQQIAEKMLKSVAEEICVGNTRVLGTHNLNTIYIDIRKEDVNFVLDRKELAFLTDFYFDARYPGDSYVDVDYETALMCMNAMYQVTDAVTEYRRKNGKPYFSYEKKYPTENTTDEIVYQQETLIDGEELGSEGTEEN